VLLKVRNGNTQRGTPVASFASLPCSPTQISFYFMLFRCILKPWAFTSLTSPHFTSLSFTHPYRCTSLYVEGLDFSATSSHSSLCDTSRKVSSFSLSLSLSLSLGLIVRNEVILRLGYAIRTLHSPREESTNSSRAACVHRCFFMLCGVSAGVSDLGQPSPIAQSLCWS
jgi:hypothetical protein